MLGCLVFWRFGDFSFVCLSVCLSVFLLFVCLFVCLSVSVYLFWFSMPLHGIEQSRWAHIQCLFHLRKFCRKAGAQ